MSELLDSSLNRDDPQAPEGSGVFDFYVDQLETYLDGELDEAEARAVRDRLAEEPAYAASLERLSRARRTRIEAIGDVCNHADDDLAAERIRAVARDFTSTGSLDGSTSQAWWRDPWALRTAVAACIVGAFCLGLYGRYDTGPSGDRSPGVAGNPVPSLNGGNVQTVTEPLDDKVDEGRDDDAE